VLQYYAASPLVISAASWQTIPIEIQQNNSDTTPTIPASQDLINEKGAALQAEGSRRTGDSKQDTREGDERRLTTSATNCGGGTPTDGDFSGGIMEEDEEAALTNRGRNNEGRGEGELRRGSAGVRRRRRDRAGGLTGEGGR
jgi:hypothetical protein